MADDRRDGGDGTRKKERKRTMRSKRTFPRLDHADDLRNFHESQVIGVRFVTCWPNVCDSSTVSSSASWPAQVITVPATPDAVS